MKSRVWLIAPIIAIPFLAGCENVTRFDDGSITRPDGSQIVYVSEHAESFDAESGDTVIIVYSGANPDQQTDCDNSGGQFVQSNRVDYCVGIDF